ncbi:hypothetical protein SDC9_170630 [bioreactor metagenome]|uniref:Uncharacterized protein n=1 Tax=bioreactor metagenome TaxID=1076179 RepID=A0A645GB88_9ZZZZ
MFDFGIITIEKFQKTGGSSGGSFYATESQGFKKKFQFLKIKNQGLKPQSRTFTNRGQLRRLVMRKTECRQIFILNGKLRKIFDDVYQLFSDQQKSVPNLDQVCIISHKCGSRAQMNDPFRQRSGIAIGMHMRHHVVPEFFFVFRRFRKVDVFGLFFQLGNLVVGNLKTQVLLDFGECDP